MAAPVSNAEPYFYVMANGMKVHFKSNTDAAKFFLFVFPKLNTVFLGDCPTYRMTPEVEKLMKIRMKMDRLREKRKALERSINDALFDDSDDIPF